MSKSNLTPYILKICGFFLYNKYMKFLSKFFKLLKLKKLANIKALASKLGFKNPAVLLRALQKNPMQVIQALDKLGMKGRQELAKSDLLGDTIEQTKDVVAEDKGPGTIEEQLLSSSWIYWGQFEYITDKIGTLWLITKYSPEEYIFPSFPAALWDLMKAARGFNGSGAGTIFWIWYRKFRTSKTAKSLRKAYR